MKAHWNSFVDSVTKHYIDFKGKADRKTFVSFSLIVLLFYVLSGVLSFVPYLSYVFWIIDIILLIPTLAIIVRRLRDRNMSPLWILLFLLFGIPGFILWIYLLIKD